MKTRMSLVEGQFHNPTKGSLTLPEVLEELFSYMKEDPKREYEVVVGCDSSAEEHPTFPLAIVVLRKRGGGRFFLQRIRYERPFYHRRERILQEVLLSCELALALREALNRFMEDRGQGMSWKFEYVHADVGQNGITKDMVKEVVGLIRGNGFEARIKPDSFVASSVADRFS